MGKLVLNMDFGYAENKDILKKISFEYLFTIICKNNFQGKNSTKDLLEKITAQLKDIESFNRDTQAWQKKVIGTLIAYFSVLYVLAIVFAYYNYYNDPEWQDVQARLKLILPFLVAPFM